MPRPTGFHETFARALAPIAAQIVTFDQAGSTMDEARALARDGAPPLTVVVADGQTAGRGRRGRAWTAEPGVALTASWIVRPPFPVERWTVLPLLVGLAAAEAVRARTGVEAKLKWPNDVMVGERKLAGVLVEAEAPSFAIAGLGVNVNQAVFPDELAATATSLALEGAVRLDRADLLAHVLHRFAEALDDPASALDRYRSLCATIGRRVRVERATGPVEGVAGAIAADGSLTVEAADGTFDVSAGEVVHLRG